MNPLGRLRPFYSNGVRIFVVLLAILALFPTTDLNATDTRPLFAKGSEVFRLVTEKSKTPVFVVLDGNPTKQALALGLTKAWKLPEREAGKPGIELRLEKLTLTPVDGKPQQLAVRVQVSGHDLELDPIINRGQFESGKAISVVLPENSQDSNLFKVTSRGSFVLQYKKSVDLLFINKASMKADFDTALGDGESESLQFNAQGIRQP